MSEAVHNTDRSGSRLANLVGSCLPFRWRELPKPAPNAVLDQLTVTLMPGWPLLRLQNLVVVATTPSVYFFS